MGALALSHSHTMDFGKSFIKLHLKHGIYTNNVYLKFYFGIFFEKISIPKMKRIENTFC